MKSNKGALSSIINPFKVLFSSIIIFAFITTSAQASFTEQFMKKIAMKQHAGFYHSLGGFGPTDPQQNLLFDLDADGSCYLQFIFFDVNPIGDFNDIRISDTSCSWEVTGFTNDGVKARVHFFEYIMDPDSIIAINGECAPGCFAMGVFDGVIENGVLSAPEAGAIFDLNMNVVYSLLSLQPDGSNTGLFIAPSTDNYLLTTDDIESKLNALGANL